MTQTMGGLRAVLAFAIAATVSACSGSTSPSSTTANTIVAPTTDVLTGSVGVPVDGVLQSAFNTFVVSLSGGTLSVTLTSAVEAMPDASLLPTVTMGVGVGTVTSGTCTLLSGAFTTAQAGSAPLLSGSGVAAGTYCVLVADVSSQLGPVTYAVAVSHY